MHLLFLTDRYAPEARAAAYLSQELAESLAAQGYQVTVLTKMPCQYVPGAYAVPRREVLNGVRVERVGCIPWLGQSLLLRPLDYILTAIVLAVRAFTLERPTLTIAYSPPLPLALVAALHRRLRGVPYVLNLHDLYPATVVELGLLKNRLVIAVARWMERVAYRNASQIIVAAPRSRRILVEEHGVPLSDVHFVPNLVNTERCAPGPRDNAFRRAEQLGGEFVVLYAGLMGVAQDLSTIIECARRMQSRRDVVFMLMGDGVYAKRWKALAQDLPNVRFHGPVANAAYTEALQASDVCLVPLSPALKSPALPGKMATIMSAGRAMIALVPPWSDAIEVIRESRCGIVTAPGRPDELESAIESLASNRRLAEELGENGRTYATQRLSLEATIPQFARVVARAIDHRIGHFHEWRGVSS